MLFNSYSFIFGFLPITLIVFFSLTKLRLVKAGTAWLVIASLAFYSYWSIAYLPLLLISIIINYQIGRYISYFKLGSRQAKILLGVGICFNLGLLGYYKYANFFVSTLNQLSSINWLFPQIILPIGISFYTFTQTAYLVDAYRGETKTYNFLTYSLFVTFFPHLIAGPILHHKDIIPQFHDLRNFKFSQKNFALGLTLFVLGLFKKVIIADNVALFVEPVFNNADKVNFVEAWVGALSYTLQLYFDFSGYSDMAVALGLMLNIRLPLNFNSPYKATSIIDFWRRWHITLSNFLRDYLYIPLGGNRHGQIRRYANLLITMLLGGLWHGAGWTFVIWGGLHGLFLVINHWWRKLSISIPQMIAWIITFIAVVISWVFFRANSLNDATKIVKAMMQLTEVRLFNQLDSMPYLIGGKESLVVSAGLILCVTLLPNTQQIITKFKPTWQWTVLVGTIATISLLSLNRVSTFLYFQF